MGDVPDAERERIREVFAAASASAVEWGKGMRRLAEVLRQAATSVSLLAEKSGSEKR